MTVVPVSQIIFDKEKTDNNKYAALTKPRISNPLSPKAALPANNLYQRVMSRYEPEMMTDQFRYKICVPSKEKALYLGK